MTTDTNATKGQTPAEDPDKDLIPLEMLDRLIADQDPDFQGSMATIAAESASRDATIELLDLDQILAEQQARTLKARFRRGVKRVRRIVANLLVSARLFVTNELPVLGKLLLARLKEGLGHAKEGLRQFGFKPLKYRLMVFAFIAICLGVGTAIALLVKRGIPEPDKLFMESIEEIADSTEEFDPAKDLEVYYDSVRATQNILVIPKLVVNLKRVATSGQNPMLAAEFFIEGNSPDVVVEIKARETEFRDVFMRTMEESNAADLETAGGKQKLLDRLVREANRLATKGRVKKVYYKTIILNP